eukprot:CAMPEP_0184489040 /NCGR_PEP_ID=MMETSP0113_2-20130426/14241_1 /TAXON_ID=91329 /ORGANISM="Norrisiella sphaerica, Strain BC52" /LENGTH=528 /DNA_ID=CAMNT_0026872227 /DNA_START=8 /DNA_END=1594 /DNA_ORIENTATION=+
MGNICSSGCSSSLALCMADSGEKMEIADKFTWTPKKSDRVVIVGAGPAGIHMASLLSKLGYNSIKLLEKTDRHGGKSYTYMDEDGVPHEFGTCYLHPDYVEIRDLLKEYKVEEVNVCKDGRCFSDVRRNNDGTGRQPFGEWLFQETEKMTDVPKDITKMIPDEVQGLTIFAKSRIYTSIHEKIFGKYKFCLPHKPDNMEDINMTFLEFLKKHDCMELVPLLRYNHEVQGYGPLDEIPALYGLWWNQPNWILKMIKVPPPDVGAVAMLKKGFSELWDKIAKTHKLNIEYNTNISKIKRCCGSDNHTEITYKLPDGSEKTEVCDVVYLAAPMDKMLEVLESPSEREKELFGDLTSSTLALTLVECDARGEEEAPVVYFPNRYASDKNLCYGWRDSARSIFLDKGVAMTKEDEEGRKRDRKLAIQYNNFYPSDRKALKSQLMKDLNESGLKNIKVIEDMKMFRYMPRFKQEQIMKGFPWEVRKHQGFRKCFYIGSSVSYESVLDVVRYNLDIHEKLKEKLQSAKEAEQTSN